MKNKLYAFLLVFAFSYGLQAQLNNYKYIIVPKNFVGFKTENQYKTSTLIKHLFSEKGFNVVYDDNLPQDLNSNRCLGLLVQLNHKSSMFATTASMTLKDCNNKEIYVTGEGRSKSKDYIESYKEAITDAFASLNNISYNYKPVEIAPQAAIPVAAAKEVNEIKESKIEEQDKDISPAISEQTDIAMASGPGETQGAAVMAIPTAATATAVAAEVWYAQQIPNGYQLVDSTPKIRLKVYNTSMPNIFIGVSEKSKGLVYSKNSKWFFEYYDDDQLRIEEFTIKF
jgi:hypothetical protein